MSDAVEAARRQVKRYAPTDVTRTPFQIDAYNVARAYLDLLSREAGWEPIETAPKDGTVILACVLGFQPLSKLPFEPRVVRWVEYKGTGRWCIDPETFMEQAHFDEYWSGTVYHPTHWRALPSPPLPQEPPK